MVLLEICRWLMHIFDILECIRTVCSDYSRIAAEEDEDYRRYSPYMDKAMAGTMVFEFDIDEPLPTFQKPKIFSKGIFEMVWYLEQTNIGRYSLRRENLKVFSGNSRNKIESSKRYCPCTSPSKCNPPEALRVRVD